MALLYLIRHAVTAQTGKTLYGTSPGIELSATGRRQARDLAQLLRRVPFAAIYSSPLERCISTAQALADGRRARVETEPGLAEVDYGDWTGRSFTWLRRQALWKRLHEVPSAIRFPGGETLAEVMARGVAAVASIAERHDREAVAVVSHGDVIRLVLAHHAGLHLDLFRRIDVDVASVSVLELVSGSPRLLRVNQSASLPMPEPPKRKRVRG